MRGKECVGARHSTVVAVIASAVAATVATADPAMEFASAGAATSPTPPPSAATTEDGSSAMRVASVSDVLSGTEELKLDGTNLSIVAQGCVQACTSLNV